MSFFAKTGSSNTNTGTSDVVITGLGFTPKILIIKCSRNTSTTDSIQGIGAEISLGFGTGSGSNQRAIGGRQSITVFKAISRDDNIIANAVTAGTVDGLLGIKTMDSDGFTLQVNNAMGANQRFHYLALGGTDIVSTAVGTITEPASTGDQDTTGLGFQPDGVLFLAGNLGTPPATGADSVISFGMGCLSAGSSTIANAVMSHGGNDGSSTVLGYCLRGECVALYDAAITVTDARASLTAFLTDGFRLNWSERAGTTRKIFYLAIKGPIFAVGGITTLTNTTSDIDTDNLGMDPIGAVVMSAVQSTENAADTPAAGWVSSHGFFSKSSTAIAQRVATERPTDSSTAVLHSDVYLDSGTTVNLGSMRVREPTHHGFKSRMSTAEASAGRFALVLAFGTQGNETPTLPKYSGLRGLGPPVIRQLRRPPYFPATGVAAAVDVTVALTGVSTTASPGSLSVVFSLALTGNAATASPGTLSPSLTHTLTGNFATASPGTLGVVFNRALTGNSATGSPGTLSPSHSNSLTGNAATGSPGTLSVSMSHALTGNAATGSPGTLSPALAHALTGVVGTGSAGSTSPSNSQALTGPSASALAGDLSVSSAVGLTGITASVTAGILSAVITIGLTGNEATGSPGSTEVQGIVLTGVQATVFAGTMGVEISTALSGVIASLFPGTVIYFTPPPPPPGQTLALLLDAAFMAPPSSENPYTAGRKLAAVYCAWATAYRTQLSSAPTGLTTAGYQQLAADLGRIIATQGWRPTAAFAFSEAFTAMWRASGVIFGSEAVTSVGGTRELTLALSESWDPPLLRRTGFGVSLYPSWYNIALALTIYTDTVRTASGLIVYT